MFLIKEKTDAITKGVWCTIDCSNLCRRMLNILWQGKLPVLARYVRQLMILSVSPTNINCHPVRVIVTHELFRCLGNKAKYIQHEVGVINRMASPLVGPHLLPLSDT